jgi:hypothetical protein
MVLDIGTDGWILALVVWTLALTGLYIGAVLGWFANAALLLIPQRRANPRHHHYLKTLPPGASWLTHVE